MDVREKLVELIGSIGYGNGSLLGNNFQKGFIEKIATHLIANGATVQEQDGCDYCQLFDDPCGVPMIAQEESESDRGIYLYNGFLCANGGEFCEARVNFCPMCGRRFPQPPKEE